MLNLCDICTPEQVVAYKKMLILSSDPCTTIWVCDECVEEYDYNEDCIIGDEETIEELWQEEETGRFEYASTDSQHHCPRCDEDYSDIDEGD